MNASANLAFTSARSSQVDNKEAKTAGVTASSTANSTPPSTRTALNSTLPDSTPSKGLFFFCSISLPEPNKQTIRPVKRRTRHIRTEPLTESAANASLRCESQLHPLHYLVLRTPAPEDTAHRNVPPRRRCAPRTLDSRSFRPRHISPTRNTTNLINLRHFYNNILHFFLKNILFIIFRHPAKRKGTLSSNLLSLFYFLSYNFSQRKNNLTPTLYNTTLPNYTK